MSKENTNPDGGYDHWHDFGTGGLNANAEGIPWTIVDQKSPLGSTGPGIDPKTGMPKGSSTAPGGSVGGEARKLGIT